MTLPLWDESDWNNSFSGDDWDNDSCMALSDVPQRQRAKKGSGRESKANAPDPYDNYDMEKSPVFFALMLAGHARIHSQALFQFCKAIEEKACLEKIILTTRNRPAHRRKPNIYHWLDENGDMIWRFLSDPDVMKHLETRDGRPQNGRMHVND
jgi:hypothetical protein